MYWQHQREETSATDGMQNLNYQEDHMNCVWVEEFKHAATLVCTHADTLKPQKTHVLIWMEEGYMSLRGVKVNLDTSDIKM